MDKVPSGQWYCERCSHLKKNASLKCRDINCFLCDEVTGAMKCIDQVNNIWAHVICVNWAPEIYF